IQGSQVSEDHLQRVAAILDYCRQRGITVIGFSPPYSPAAYAMMRDGGHQTYIPQAAARLTALFPQYGDTYFDFTDPTPLGVTDSDCGDVWHGSDYVALQVYIAMLRQSPDTLGRYSDLSFLEALAEQSPHWRNILDFANRSAG